MVKRRRWAIVAAALGFPLVACQLLAGIDERYVAEGGPDATEDGVTHDATRDAGLDGVSDAVKDAGLDRGNLCPGAQPPPPPDGSSNTMEGPIDFFVGVQTLWYDLDASGGVDLGYNLDNTCTCEGTPPGPPSCVDDAGRNCDGEGGRDLAGNVLLTALDSLGGTSVAALLNSKISSGQIDFIMRVGDYNVGENDETVNLAAFVSGGHLPRDAGPDTGFTPPLWNGTDVWSIDPGSFATYDALSDGGYAYTPVFVDTMAYVTEKTIVSHLPTIEFGIGEASLTLSDAVMVATIAPDILSKTGGFMLTGQLVGRVSVSTIFAVASTFPDPATDAAQHFCGSDVIFATAIRPTICRAADIMSLTAQDNTGRGCNALSMALGFVAHKIYVGAPHNGVAPIVGCDGAVANCSDF